MIEGVSGVFSNRRREVQIEQCSSRNFLGFVAGATLEIPYLLYNTMLYRKWNTEYSHRQQTTYLRFLHLSNASKKT